MPGSGLQQKKGVADVVFCVDCTGSMQPCIDQLRDDLRTFIAGLEKPSANLPPLDWRIKVMGFRDLDVDATAWVNKDEPLVDTVADAQAQVAALQADGGGDEPESQLDAIWLAATKTEWRHGCTKIVVVFSDATAKDKLHSSTAAEAGADDASAVAQAIATTRAGVYVHAWAVPCPVWDTLKKLPLVALNPLPTDDERYKGLAALDFAELLRTLAMTVVATAGGAMGPGGTTPIASGGGAPLGSGGTKPIP